jgi:hypothetical protein
MNLGKLNKKHLIISLIRDDLVIEKLLEGLERLGFDTLDYNLYVSDNIFKLLGFPDDDSSEDDFLHYMEERKKAVHLNIKSLKLFDDLAKEIYWDLYFRSEEWRKSKKKPSR